MKILYILDYFHPYVGGVPNVFLNLAKEMIKNGHDVTVLTSKGKFIKHKEDLDGIRIIRFGNNREQFLLRSTLHLLLDRENFDLIHTSTYSAMIPAYIFSRIYNIPVLISFHEVWSLKEWLEFLHGFGIFYYAEERILLSLPFHQYVSPSEHTKEDMIKSGIPKDRIKVIPHGIDSTIFNPNIKKFKSQIRKELGVSENETLIAFTSKPTIFKGIDYLLKAMKKVLQMRNDVKFIFLLSPLNKSAYERFISLIKKSKFPEKNIITIVAHKEQKYAAKIIGAADAVVIPSLTEGFCFVAAESLSIGTPIIVSNTSCLPEVVGKKGIYVEPRNSKQIAEAILDVAENKPRITPKKFNTWETIAKEYETIYKKLVRKRIS